MLRFLVFRSLQITSEWDHSQVVNTRPSQVVDPHRTPARSRGSILVTSVSSSLTLQPHLPLLPMRSESHPPLLTRPLTIAATCSFIAFKFPVALTCSFLLLLHCSCSLHAAQFCCSCLLHAASSTPAPVPARCSILLQLPPSCTLPPILQLLPARCSTHCSCLLTAAAFPLQLPPAFCLHSILQLPSHCSCRLHFSIPLQLPPAALLSLTAARRLGASRRNETTKAQ